MIVRRATLHKAISCLPFLYFVVSNVFPEAKKKKQFGAQRKGWGRLEGTRDEVTWVTLKEGS